MQTTAQAANCSIEDAELLAGCMCPDGGIQYAFATCVETSCEAFEDQVGKCI